MSIPSFKQVSARSTWRIDIATTAYWPVRELKNRSEENSRGTYRALRFAYKMMPMYVDTDDHGRGPVRSTFTRQLRSSLLILCVYFNWVGWVKFSCILGSVHKVQSDITSSTIPREQSPRFVFWDEWQSKAVTYWAKNGQLKSILDFHIQ